MLKWIKCLRRREEPAGRPASPGQQAASYALHCAQGAVADAKGRQSEVQRRAQSLRGLVAQNHFAEGIAQALEGRRG